MSERGLSGVIRSLPAVDLDCAGIALVLSVVARVRLLDRVFTGWTPPTTGDAFHGFAAT